MAATAEMVAIALRTQPQCGLPGAGAPRRAHHRRRAGRGRRPRRAQAADRATCARPNIRVSLFIAADPAQIEEAAALGAPVIEIHTGAWCHALADGDKPHADAEWRRIREGAQLAKQPRARGPCRSWPRLRQRRDHRRACRRSSSSTSAIFWSAKRCSSGSTKRSRPCAAPWIAAAPGPGHAAMILGIGSDITDVRRVAKVIERHGDRFLDRIFTATERARAERRKNRVETYAKRFAAKEACAKALGTGHARRRLVARHGRGQSPERAADHATHRRGAAPAAVPDAARPRGADRSHDLRRRARWRSPTSSFRAVPAAQAGAFRTGSAACSVTHRNLDINCRCATRLLAVDCAVPHQRLQRRGTSSQGTRGQ